MYKKIIAASVLLLNINNCLASAEQAPISESKTFQKIFPDKVDAATLNIDEGDIKINVHNEKFVKVLYTPSTKECIVKIDAINSKLTINNKKKENGCSCNYQLFIPDDVVIDANLGSGKINVHDLKTKMEFNLGAGDVGIFNTSGNINLNIGAGSIEYNPAKSENVQTLEINSGSAEVNCVFPENTKVKTLPQHGFLAKIDSSVNLVEKDYNYEIQGTMGVGSIKLSYKK